MSNIQEKIDDFKKDSDYSKVSKAFCGITVCFMNVVIRPLSFFCFWSFYMTKKEKKTSAETKEVRFKPSFTLLPTSVWQNKETHSAWLDSAQVRADHPLMSSVFISVGRRRQDLLSHLMLHECFFPSVISYKHYYRKIRSFTNLQVRRYRVRDLVGCLFLQHNSTIWAWFRCNKWGHFSMCAYSESNTKNMPWNHPGRLCIRLCTLPQLYWYPLKCSNLLHDRSVCHIHICFLTLNSINLKNLACICL